MAVSFKSVASALVNTIAAEKAAEQARKEAAAKKAAPVIETRKEVAQEDGRDLFLAALDSGWTPEALGSKLDETRQGLAVLKAKAEAEKTARDAAKAAEQEAAFLAIGRAVLPRALATLRAQDACAVQGEVVATALRAVAFAERELEAACAVMADERRTAQQRLEKIGGEAGMARLGRIEDSLPGLKAEVVTARAALRAAEQRAEALVAAWAADKEDAKKFASVAKNLDIVEAKARAEKSRELCAEVAAWTFCLSFMTKDEKKAEAIAAGAKRWLKAAAGEALPLTREQMAAKQAEWAAAEAARKAEQEARVSNAGKAIVVGKGTHAGPATEAVGTVTPKSEAAKARIRAELERQANSKAANAALRAGKDVAVAKGFIPKGRNESAPQGKGKKGR